MFPLWLDLILAAVLLLFTVIAWQFLSRGTAVDHIRFLDLDGDHVNDGDLRAGDDFFCRTFEVLTDTAIVGGNRVDVLFDGVETYPRLFEDLRAARDLITWHVFWFRPGRLADQVAEILIERARAGVQVLFLYDYFGSRPVEAAYFDALRQAGIEVECFRPLRFGNLYKFQQRMHMRAVVIDGRVGYTGGFGIAEEWSGDGRHEGQWRDTSVRLEGEVVSQLQGAFASNWAEATGQLLMGDRVFPPEHDRRGEVEAGILYGAPTLGSTNAERFYFVSIEGSLERLYITNPYFVPDDDFRPALVNAVQRGADVRILTPGRNSDRKSTWYAGRAHYEELLEGGVRIYEYRPTMVHAKTLVADERWAAIGTINFDNRSMALNDEVGCVVRDAAVAGRLAERFLEDLELADELDLDTFRARPRLERLKERWWLIWVRFL